MAFKGLVKDSVGLYIVTKAVKRARRRSKRQDVECFTPEFKARISNWLNELDERSKVKYAEAKEKRGLR